MSYSPPYALAEPLDRRMVRLCAEEIEADGAPFRSSGPNALADGHPPAHTRHGHPASDLR